MWDFLIDVILYSLPEKVQWALVAFFLALVAIVIIWTVF